MLKIPISILMTIAIFIVFLAVLYRVFGTPDCDSLANQTAYSLKLSIDNVANDQFPTWTGSEAPTDNDYTYYRTSSIRLCQEKGTTFWESFFGNPPEYQIYYEHFPEGGGGTWNEAYPWSGGASGTLKFWGAMRIGTGAWKLGTKYYTSIGALSTSVNFIKGKWTQLRKVVTGFFKEPSEMQKVIDAMAEKGIIFAGNRRSATILVRQLKEEEGKTALKKLQDMGFIVEDSAKDISSNEGKIIIRDAPNGISIKIPEKDSLGVVTDRTLYVKKDASGNIVDMTTDIDKAIKESFQEYKANPAEIYRDYLNSVGPEQRKYLNDIYAIEGETKGIIQKIKELPQKIKDTEFYRKYFKPTEEKLATYVKKIDAAGYRTEISEAYEPHRLGGIADAIQAMAKDPATKDDMLKLIRSNPTIMDRVKSFSKLTTLEKATDEHIYSYLNTMQDELSGIVFFPKGMQWEIDEIAIKEIEEAASRGEYTSITTIKRIVDNMPQDIIDKYGGGTTGWNKVYDIVSSQVWGDVPDAATLASSDVAKRTFTSEVYQSYMKNVIAGVKSGDEGATQELGLMFGLLEQNTNTLPMTWNSAFANGAKREIKKVVYLDGPQNIINPAGWYAQGMLATIALEKCEGNSICLLSKSSMEVPLYLNKTADAFDIRVWRPVSPIAQWVGIQTALMHVPEHPRFYVVSPCFATAKVWKAFYGGKETIFVYPQKIETNDSSNYCYADSDLINQYVAIWDISDLLSFLPLPTIFNKIGLGEKVVSRTFSAAGKVVETTVSDTLEKIIGIADPVTLIQGIAESAISWPGAPWTPLEWKDMVEAQENAPILQTEKKSVTNA